MMIINNISRARQGGRYGQAKGMVLDVGWGLAHVILVSAQVLLVLTLGLRTRA